MVGWCKKGGDDSVRRGKPLQGTKKALKGTKGASRAAKKEEKRESLRKAWRSGANSVRSGDQFPKPVQGTLGDEV